MYHLLVNKSVRHSDQELNRDCVGEGSGHLLGCSRVIKWELHAIAMPVYHNDDPSPILTSGSGPITAIFFVSLILSETHCRIGTLNKPQK